MKLSTRLRELVDSFMKLIAIADGKQEQIIEHEKLEDGVMRMIE